MGKDLFIILLTFLYPFLLISNNNVINSDNYLNKYGIIGYYGILNSDSDFSSLPSIPNCCPKFDRGKGFSAYFGGITEADLKIMRLQARLGFEILNGNFQNNENQVISVNNSPVDAVFQHNVDFRLINLNVDLNSAISITNRLNVHGGLSISAILNSNYYQYEKINSPAGNVTFLDNEGNNTGKSIRNELEGSIPEINTFQYGVNLGISYDFYPIKDRIIIIRPEITYNHNFSNVVNNLEWKNNILRVGVSLLLSNELYTEPAVPEITLSDYKTQKQDSTIAKLNSQIVMLEEKKLQDSIVKKELQDKENELEKLRMENAAKDSIINYNKLKSEEELKLKIERDQFNKQIIEENKRAGKICKCFVILYKSTQDKKEAESLIELLSESGIADISLTTFIEPYLKTKYYRVQSECFADHLQAFDERIRSIDSLGDSEINPQIICNR